MDIVIITYEPLAYMKKIKLKDNTDWIEIKFHALHSCAAHMCVNIFKLTNVCINTHTPPKFHIYIRST